MLKQIKPDHNPAKLGVLVSGGGTTLDNFVRCINNGSLKAEITCVIASNEHSYKKIKQRHQHLNTQLIARRDYDSVARFSSAVFEQIKNAQTDLICLAGFLSLLSIPEDFENRVINIHPALLPDFGGKGMFGKHVHQAVLDAGRKESGCTVHFADNTYDTGAIILQRKCAVEKNDTAKTLAARVFEQECIAYPKAINLLVEGKVSLEGKRAIIG